MYQGFFQLPQALHLSIYDYLSPKELYQLYHTYMLNNNRQLSSFVWQALLIRRDDGAYKYQTKLLKHFSAFPSEKLPRFSNDWAMKLEALLKDLPLETLTLETDDLSYLQLATVNRLRGISILKRVPPSIATSTFLQNSTTFRSFEAYHPLINRFLKNGTPEEQRYTLSLLAFLIPHIPIEERAFLATILIDRLQDIKDTTVCLDKSYFSCLVALVPYLKADKLYDYFCELVPLSLRFSKAIPCLEALLSRLSHREVNTLVQEALRGLNRSKKECSKNSSHPTIDELTYLTLFVRYLKSAECLTLINVIINELTVQKDKRYLPTYKTLFQYLKKFAIGLNEEHSNTLSLMGLETLGQSPISAITVVVCDLVVVLAEKLRPKTLTKCINTLICLYDASQPLDGDKKIGSKAIAFITCLSALTPYLQKIQRSSIASFLLKNCCHSTSQRLLLSTLDALTTMAPYLKEETNQSFLQALDRALEYLQIFLYYPVPFYLADTGLSESIRAAAMRCQAAFSYRLSTDRLHFFYQTRIYPSLLAISEFERQAAVDCFTTLQPFLNKKERQYILNQLEKGLQDRNLETLCRFSDCVPLLFKSCEAPEVFSFINLIQQQLKEILYRDYSTEEVEEGLDENDPLLPIQIGLSFLSYLPPIFFANHGDIFQILHHQILQDLPLWSLCWFRSFGYQYLANAIPYFTQKESETAFNMLMKTFTLEYSNHYLVPAANCLKCLILCSRHLKNSQLSETVFNLLVKILLDSSTEINSIHQQITLCPTVLQGLTALFSTLNPTQRYDYTCLMLTQLSHADPFMRQASSVCLSSFIMHLDGDTCETVSAELCRKGDIERLSLDALAIILYLNLHQKKEVSHSPSSCVTVSQC